MLGIMRTTTMEINYQFTITKSRKMDIDDYSFKENNILPTEISFEDYQSLAKEDIDKLYPKDKMEEENKKANSLHTKATGTFDKILNSVLFNKELELDNSELSKMLSSDLDLILNSWEFPEQFTFTMEKTETYIQRDYLIFPPLLPCCCCCFNPYNSIIQAITRNHLEYAEITEVLDEQKKINADDLFRTFENSAEAYRKKFKEFEKSTTEHFSYAKKIFSYYDSIKEEYQKRISERGSILNYYTKNSGVNLIDNGDANVEDDQYGLIAWRDMSNEEKNEYAEDLKKQYLKTEYKGKDIQAGMKASTEIIKRNLASEFDDSEIQKSILDGMSGMSFLDAANFQQEIIQNLSNYQVGKPYSPIYELQSDKNGVLQAMVETSKNILANKSFSKIDYKNFLLDLIKEHESNRVVVGSEQVDRYINVYKAVLNNLKSKDSNVISYNRYNVSALGA